MNKTLAIILVSLLAFSALTACGSKSDNTDTEMASRVLYSDTDSIEQETKKITTTSSSVQSSTDTDSQTDTNSDSKSEANSKKNDSQSKKNESKTTTSSKKESVSSSAPTSVSSSDNSSSCVQIESNSIDNTSSEYTKEEDNSNENTAENSSETQTDNTFSSEASNETDTFSDENNNTENISVNELSQDDFKAAIKGFDIRLEDNIKDVVASLGEPIDIIKAPSCKYAGLEDKTYIYDGFTINTYPNEDGSLDYVAGIEITSEAFETSRCIKIGSSIEEMTAAYGENFTTVGNTYRYTLDDKILSFYAEGDSIRGISFILNN